MKLPIQYDNHTNMYFPCPQPRSCLNLLNILSDSSVSYGDFFGQSLSRHEEVHSAFLRLITPVSL